MDAHWRDTMRPARFFMLDARAAIGVALVLVHARLWTISFAILLMFVFYALEQRGLHYSAALRGFRSWLCGQNRPAVLKVERSHFADLSDTTPVL